MENKAVAAEKNDVVPVELPAPPGWKKRFTPSKSGTPRRNDIVFVSPDGDEIKNKRQLDKYLKSHPGEPPASEFDWGRGDTPRRSTRLGEKSKATETPESDTPSKRQRKSSSKKGVKEDDGEQEAEGATEKETKGETPEGDTPTKRQRKSSSKKGVKEDDGKQEAEGATEKETKASDEPALPDAEDLEVQDVEIASKKVLTDGDNIKNEEEKNNDAEIVPREPSASEDKMEIEQEQEETKDEEEKTNDADIVPEEPLASEDKVEIVQEKEETKDEEEKTNDGEVVLEEPLATEDKMEIVQEKEETLDEGNIEKLEDQEAEDKPLDDSLKTDNEMLPSDVPEENKTESKSAGTDASSHSAELSKPTSASQEESAEEVPVAADALNVLEENKIETKPAGADASSHSAELSKPTSVSQEETAEEAPAAADTLVQNSNDCKVDENEQIDREVPIEEINATEAAAEGVNNSVENNSVQQEATAIDQATSS